MKELLRVIFILWVISLCNPLWGKGTFIKETKRTIKLLKMLKKASRQATPFFGHQDDLMYGQNWWIDEKDTSYIKSDTYMVTGKYPYVLGLDISRIELGKEKNVDGVPFSMMRKAALKHYNRGGIVTVSWHISNIKTEGLYKDCSTGELVKDVLRDSTLKVKYMVWLKRVADYLETYTDSEGKRISILFRPFHECNITGHWWSGKLCSNEDYKELWRLSFEYLVTYRRLDNLIWVYSPYNMESTEELGAKYPGDRYVDIIGYERYQLGAKTYKEGAERFAAGASKGLDITISFAKKHKKIAAFTETGFPGVPYDKWWTEALGKAIKGKEIAYILVWRNGVSENYYFGPCLKSTSSSDFKRLVNAEQIQLLEVK